MLYLSVVVQDGKKGERKWGFLEEGWVGTAALSNVELRKAYAQSNLEVRR